MKLRPIGDKIVVAKTKGDKSTKSGLIIPQKASHNPIGTVVAVGSGRLLSNGTLVPFEVKIGDEVMFQDANCTVENVDGVDMYLMYETNVLAVVE